MTFSEIIADARRVSKSNVGSYPTSEIVASANRALERIASIIRTAQGRWQWDDSNFDTLPSATADLVSEQQDYELDSTHYQIERVEVKDSEGNWHKLLPIDQADVFDQSITDFLNTPGLPQYYDKVGNSILLFPKPLSTSVTATAGLKVFYQRGPDYFTTSDSIKTPGFNPLFHRLVSLWAAYDYSFINKVTLAPLIKGEIDGMESQLMEHYAFRDRDEHIRLTTRKYNFR